MRLECGTVHESNTMSVAGYQTLITYLLTQTFGHKVNCFEEITKHKFFFTCSLLLTDGNW